MTKRRLGIIVPCATTLIAVIIINVILRDSVLRTALITGLTIALVQSLLSTGALLWAWERKSFYWVWGSGMLARLIVLAVTAFVVYRFTDLSLVATLITLVVSSTIFLVFESSTVFSKPK